MRRQTHEFLSRRGRKPNAAGGRRGFHTACRPLAPPCKRLASAIRARHGRHGKLTLYRDVAGAEPVSSMATGSEEDIILFVFGMIDMYTPKCNKKPKEFMQIAYQVNVD